jgi:hypothetical protein
MSVMIAGLLVAIFASPAPGKKQPDDTPIVLTQQTAQSQLFSANDLHQLWSHDATLRAIDLRLAGIDDKLKGIQGTLDNDVLPTIHVFNFLKWLFALIVAAIVGAAVNNRYKPSRTATS